MIFPLLQRERSIDDFIDKEEGCRLAAVLADDESSSQEETLYIREIRGLVREALIRAKIVPADPALQASLPSRVEILHRQRLDPED